MGGVSWLSQGDSYQSEAASKLMAPVNGFSLVQGLDLGIFPGKLAPADFLDHLCVVGREGEVSQICEI